MPTPKRSNLLAIAAAIFFSTCAFAQTELALQRARESFAEYQKEAQAKQESLAQGDFKAADQHETAGRTSLLNAQRAYEESGAPKRATKDVLFDYANVLRALGYFDLAGEAMEAAVKLDPSDARAWSLLGACEIECGPKYEIRGLEALQKSIALDPSSKDAAATHLALGKLYYNQGLFAFAQEEQEKAIAADPGNIEAVIRLAALNVRTGKILEASSAIDGLDRAAQPFDALTRVLLRESLAVFENDGRYFDDKPENHAAYARLLYRASRVPEAILAATRAVHEQPTDTKTLNFIGSMYMQMGNANGARQAFQKSLDADPNQPEIKKTIDSIPADDPKPAAAPAPPTQ